MRETAPYSQERRWHDDRGKIPDGQDRRRTPQKLQAPLPQEQRPERPLPDPSDWSFELIEQYHTVIAATARQIGRAHV